MHPITCYAIYALLAINLITFIVYGVDKIRAKQCKWRISETKLLMLAAVGGSIGAIIATRIWHHKTLHAKFKYGLPLILIAQLALIIWLGFELEWDFVMLK